MPHPRKATRKVEKYWITYLEIFKLNKKTLQNTARINLLELEKLKECIARRFTGNGLMISLGQDLTANSSSTQLEAIC